MRPVILAIGGSDPSGGAGIPMDTRVIDAWGGWPASVVTAVTAQNTGVVRAAAALDGTLVREQIDAVFDDLAVVAVKTGMLATAEVVGAVAKALAEREPRHVVVDPVLVSGGGTALADPDAMAALRDELLPHCTVVTPNAMEAERLTGVRVRGLEEAVTAGRALLDLGAPAALVKGGHLEEAPGTDVLVHAGGVTAFAPDWVDDANPVHGTGCALASALAAALALGEPLEVAAAHARTFVRNAIRTSIAIGSGGRCLVPSEAISTEAPS